MKLNVLGLQPRIFNCKLENVKSQKGYTFNSVKQFSKGTAASIFSATSVTAAYATAVVDPLLGK